MFSCLKVYFNNWLYHKNTIQFMKDWEKFMKEEAAWSL